MRPTPMRTSEWGEAVAGAWVEGIVEAAAGASRPLLLLRPPMPPLSTGTTTSSSMHSNKHRLRFRRVPPAKTVWQLHAIPTITLRIAPFQNVGGAREAGTARSGALSSPSLDGLAPRRVHKWAGDREVCRDAISAGSPRLDRVDQGAWLHGLSLIVDTSFAPSIAGY